MPIGIKDVAVMTIQDNLVKQSYRFRADCEACFGLCCVALPYAKSADFAFNKDSGEPCKNLQQDYRCGIHSSLREKGFRGCTVYECFGAGQHVSQVSYRGQDWRNNPALAKEMFEVFPIMQQLFEMLYYLDEALHRAETEPIHEELKVGLEETLRLTQMEPIAILSVDVQHHRVLVNEGLLKASELVRAHAMTQNKMTKDKDRIISRELIGAKLHGAKLSGQSLRGALLIAADLRNADLRMVDFIGADLRDADLSGANLSGSLFLTQAQITAAKGSKTTKLPEALQLPEHWLLEIV